MFKIIIIDDEEEARQGLLENIAWDKLGILVSGEAENGIKGLELAKQVHPDIILADIRMPKMDGIKFARQIRNDFPDCKIIFMSGYTDKEYLKSAIQLKAIDYIEKPIDLDELFAVLKKSVILCKEELNKRMEEEEIKSQVAQSKFMYQQEIALELIHRNIDISAIKKQFVNIGIQASINDIFVCILFKFNLHKLAGLENGVVNSKNNIVRFINKAFSESGSTSLSALLDREHVIVHVSGKLTENVSLLKETLTKIKTGINLMYSCGDFTTIGVGRLVRGIENLAESYHCARKALGQMFLIGYDHIFFHQENGAGINPQEYFPVQEICDSIKKLDIRKVKVLTETAIAAFKKIQRPDIKRVKDAFLSILISLSSVMEENGYPAGEDGKRQEITLAEMLNVYTMDEIMEFILNKLVILEGQYEEKRGKSRKVRTAIDFIKRNFTQDVPVSLIAEQIGVTSTYLCKLFKKEMEKTVNEYIEELRIEYSKELLKDDGMKLIEVARKVGYNNANYYSTVFKKVVGEYPSEYRRKVL